MTTIIVSLRAERFGLEERHQGGTPYVKNRRAAKISQLRQELRSLKRQFKQATEGEKGPLSELRSILRKKLKLKRG